MPSLIAVIAALPHEVQALVRGVKPEPSQVAGVQLYRLPSALVVSGGMGAGRASLAFQAALRAGNVAQVISFGLAGACDPALVVGSVITPGRVVDANTGERFATVDAGGPVLVSTSSIASVQEKGRLKASYGASLVDMEAATVGRLAVAHGLPFRAVKGISDAYDFELAALSRFTGKQGEFRTAAFAFHTAMRPALWPAAVTLGRGSKQALAATTKRLREILSAHK